MTAAEEGAPRLGKTIRSKTFTPTGKNIGYGTWSSVGEYTDPSGQGWAIKVSDPIELARAQMKHRRTSEERVLDKEATIPLDAARHGLVPRIIGVDDEGTKYVAMPVWKGGSLSRAFGDDGGDRRYLGHGAGLDEILKIARGTAHALAYTHNELGTIHQDLILKNIVLDGEGNPGIIDWGTATVASPSGQSSDPRDNMGAFLVRPYEGFREGSHADTRFDVFNFGAVLGRLLTGKYPHEEGFANAKDGDKYMLEMGEEQADGVIRDYARGVPKPFRELLTKCLAHNPDNRYKDGEELEKALGKAISRYERSQPRARMKRWGGLAAAAVVLTALAGTAVNSYLSKSGLEQQVAQKAENTEVEKKRRIVDLYLQRLSRPEEGKYFNMDYMDYVADGELSAWTMKFKDEKVAIAAFFNPDAVYASIRDLGITDEKEIESVSFEQIKDTLDKRDSKTYWTVWNINSNLSDTLQRIMRSERFSGAQEKWKKARERYETEQLSRRLSFEAQERQKNTDKSLPKNYQH